MKVVLLSLCLLSRVQSRYKKHLQCSDSRSVFASHTLKRDEMQAPSHNNSTQCHNSNSRYNTYSDIQSNFRRTLTSNIICKDSRYNLNDSSHFHSIMISKTVMTLSKRRSQQLIKEITRGVKISSGAEWD